MIGERAQTSLIENCRDLSAIFLWCHSISSWLEKGLREWHFSDIEIAELVSLIKIYQGYKLSRHHLPLKTVSIRKWDWLYQLHWATSFCITIIFKLWIRILSSFIRGQHCSAFWWFAWHSWPYFRKHEFVWSPFTIHCWNRKQQQFTFSWCFC